MTQYKATYKGFSESAYEKNYYNQHWEYRGHEYIVTVPVGWSGSTDYYNGGYMSKKKQHEREQAAIDAMLDNQNREIHEAYTGAVEKALDEFFAFVEQ